MTVKELAEVLNDRCNLAMYEKNKFTILRGIFQIAKNIAQGCYLADMKDEIRKSEKEK